jgi:hypothetical protein
MAASPSVARTAYFTLEDRGLVPVPPPVAGEMLLVGWFVFGHEVRTFKPCAAERDLRVIGTSPALNDLAAAHRRAIAEAPPYMPLFVTVAGRLVDAPWDGFGANHSGGLDATRLVQAWPRGKCTDGLAFSFTPSFGNCMATALGYRRLRSAIAPVTTTLSKVAKYGYEVRDSF